MEINGTSILAIPKNLFSLEHQQYDPKTVLNIRWGSEKYTIDFPGKILGHIKLGELREICKDLTGVPLEYVPKYEQDVETYIQSNPAPFSFQSMPPARKRLQDTHGMLSENLLQSLLRLDGVTCQPEFEVARVKRREAVKETQRLLDHVDGINARVKKTDMKA
ncbi:hypothetical protein BGZ92_010823 [Podila epicladia]|nr:hypothetical protein BGZ92_010823 [Podila epicladia]